MNNKNLIEATLKVLGRLNYTDSIKETEGTEIAGEYWMALTSHHLPGLFAYLSL